MSISEDFDMVVRETQMDASAATPDDWAWFINEWAEEKGWNEDLQEGNQAMLMCSEIAEGFEEFRKDKPLVYEVDGKPEGQAVEYADALIRILHWFGHKGVDVNEVLAMKMAYNQKRPYRHGGLKA